MAPSSRNDGSLNLNLSGLSPIAEPGSSTSAKSPFTGPKANNTGLSSLGGSRIGAGSPLHDQTARLFPKRTRELQTPTGGTSNIWGPPTSGTSTPLFEIPESPSQDGFPDLVPLTESGINSPARRGRAGTLPSRISPVGSNGTQPALLTSKTSRPTPSSSPFRPSSASVSESAFGATPVSANSTLLSRLRAGSMPQRPSTLAPSNAFASSAFTSNWGSRARASTLNSISSADDPSSPQQGALGKEDPGVRTLDYLGLAETPAQDPISLTGGDRLNPSVASSLLLSNLNSRTASRFRSFSVNTQPRYGGEIQESGISLYPQSASGTMTPSDAAILEAEYQALQEQVRLHNQAVQEYALNASAARPRARTAGLIEIPQHSAFRRFGQRNPADYDDQAASVASELGLATSNGGIHDLSGAVHAMSLNDPTFDVNEADFGSMPFDLPDENPSQMSRSLWIGSIPNSTTVSTLDTIFSSFGSIESTRVLTHKNCGFVNFEAIPDAVRAKQTLNGKEIFPGGGPVRIGFAKAPANTTASVPATQSQSPMPNGPGGNPTGQQGHSAPPVVESQRVANGKLPSPLSEMQADIVHIAAEFGAHPADVSLIETSLARAVAYSGIKKETPPIPDPSPNRVFDAPRLRDVRKRIDTGACSLQEVEQIATDMLPEIAELSSDYLGNTVVQKLFELCSEQTKEQMLMRIAPHLAEIGVHKNGTWAAQKIIDVCKTETQTKMIVDNIRPYTVPLFLDQFGNYVLQCCLRFGSPFNDFIFETMCSELMDIAQGRFGARAMRACLESHHATKHQQRMLAATITMHVERLVTNANGALLLTWLLDTCTFPKRRSVLAPRLIANLASLCTHKVAYLTVLKIVNQRNEPEARDAIIKALFYNPDDTVLEQILSDPTSGVTFVFKVLATSFVDETSRPEVVRIISNILLRIKAQPNQGYKRLMDEVGLSARPSQMSQFPAHSHPHNAINTDRAKHGGMHSNKNGHGPSSFPMHMGGGAPGFESNAGPARPTSAESFGYPMYGGMTGLPPQQQQGYPPMSPFHSMNSQSQFQSFNSPAQRSVSVGGAGAYMPNAFSGYNTPPSSVDVFRGMQNASASPMGYAAQMSPVMNGGGNYAQPYGAQQNMGMGAGGNMYNYHNGAGGQSMYQFNPQMQPIHAGGRGRRR